MANVVEKMRGTSNANVLVTERGVSFGYNTLVSDMRALPVLAKIGAPVIFDATHRCSSRAGRHRLRRRARFVPVLARAAVAVGVANGVFIEPTRTPTRRHPTDRT